VALTSCLPGSWSDGDRLAAVDRVCA